MRCLPALVSLILLIAGPLAAQASREVRGTVRDSVGAPLGAAVVHPGGLRTTAGAQGTFVIQVPGGPTRLIAAQIGFAPETLVVAPDESRVEFRLKPRAVALDPVRIQSDRARTLASSRLARELDLRLRLHESSQELLERAPGLVIAQHAGGGKAEQIFLRGFDADHGTDVAISADGVPVNMVSHAHGQGYADLHFLIPELVQSVEVRKGPYRASDGDLATAGAVDFETRDRVDASLSTRAGSFGTVSGLLLAPLGGDASRSGGYLAAALHRSEGPFIVPQGYRRFNLFGKWTGSVAALHTEASAVAFDSRWDASGQVPARAVADGRLPRFGAIDASEGGSTSRYGLNASIGSAAGAPLQWIARAYAGTYRLQLFSNFTFFARDSVHGDGIEQLDSRILAGASVRGSVSTVPFGSAGVTSAGGSIRSDRAAVSLFDQAGRLRRGVRSADHISQQHLGGWLSHEVAAGPVRLEAAVRADAFRFAVNGSTSGAAPVTRVHAIVSPKLSLVVDAAPGTALFANLGFGFHSNDARDAVSAPAGAVVLPRAAGAELGARHWWGAGSAGAALWALDLESELVWVGDEGVTAESGRTRRIGADVEGRIRIVPWLWVDADVNLARGRSRDLPVGSNRIPLAPTFSAAGGLTVRDAGAVSGGARIRHIRRRPADEANRIQALGASLVELFARWSAGPFSLAASIENLFDVDWNEAQFATTSRLRGEAEPVTDLHFTPGAGRSVQISAEWRF